MVADGLKSTMEVIDVAYREILANKPCLELSRVLVGFPASKVLLNKKYKFLTDARKSKNSGRYCFTCAVAWEQRQRQHARVQEGFEEAH